MTLKKAISGLLLVVLLFYIVMGIYFYGTGKIFSVRKYIDNVSTAVAISTVTIGEISDTWNGSYTVDVGLLGNIPILGDIAIFFARCYRTVALWIGNGVILNSIQAALLPWNCWEEKMDYSFGDSLNIATTEGVIITDEPGTEL